jgi:PleD family two-component response regulator
LLVCLLWTTSKCSWSPTTKSWRAIEPAIATRSTHILIINDDRTLARYLETMLVRHGQVVKVAHTSSDALVRRPAGDTVQR